jgi:SAM-dependent methyltransferase
MVADRVRVDAYAQALRKTVRHGAIVVEIGAGPGIFAVLACQLGASRVYAIEPSEIIQVAREIAVANGCNDKIEFFEEVSSRVTLPERADVILSDLRGVLPLFGRHIPEIVDARRRFLAPGGTLIPRKDTLWAAIVEVPKLYSDLVNPWEHNPFGQDLRAARRLAVNNIQKSRVNEGQLLTMPRLWGTLDYYSVENHNVQGDLHWEVERAGTGHGIQVWFDAELAEGCRFSCGPSEPQTIYGSLFLPWTRPVSLAPYQHVTASLDARLIGDDYIYRWTSRIEPLGGSGDTPVHFEQSQLMGEMLSVAKLQRLAADYVPHLSVEGRLHRRTFELMDGRASIEEIAHRLAAEFPERFLTWKQALSYAGVVSRKYSEEIE